MRAKGLSVMAFAFLFVVALEAQPAPQKDVLVFTNGDQLTGTLERSAGGSVVFKSDMAGEITVPLTKVKELRTEGSFALLKHGDPISVSRSVVPGRIVLADGNVAVQTNPAGTGAVVPVKDVAYLVDEKTFNRDLTHTVPPWRGWGGAVNLGTSFTQATIHGGSLTTGIALVRQIPLLTYFSPRNKTILNFQENYGVLTTPAGLNGSTVQVQSKTSIMHADAERDEYFTRRFFAFGATGFDHNYALSLDLQQLYGGGIGWTVFSKPVHQLDLKGDAHYEKQHFFGGVGDTNLFGSTFSEAYRRTLPLKVSLLQTASYLPAWNDTRAYSANGSITLTAPLIRRLSVNTNFTDTFLNNPVPGYQKNSFTFTTGLTYSLR